MKIKFVITGLALLGALSFSSCKKDFTCKCTTSVDGEEQGSGTATINATKKDAKNECEGKSEEATMGGSTFKTTCVIE